MATPIYKLSAHEIDKLIARIHGIEVVEYRYNDDVYCAIEQEFDPETPSNMYDLKSFKMWTWYQPTKDWELIGPIINEHRIFISPSIDPNVKQHTWAHCEDKFGDTWYVHAGETAQEAAAKTYVQKVYGETIDWDNLPVFMRVARVRISGLSESADLFDLDISDLIDFTVDLTVETYAEAIRKASVSNHHVRDLRVTFEEWVSPLNIITK